VRLPGWNNELASRTTPSHKVGETLAPYESFRVGALGGKGARRGVNAVSSDNTTAVVETLLAAYSAGRYGCNAPIQGSTDAARLSIVQAIARVVAIAMVDGPYTPANQLRYVKSIRKKYECRFSSRFTGGTTARKCARLKRLARRVADFPMAGLARSDCNDFTSKCRNYRRVVVQRVLHIIRSRHSV
jgi:hypothetical protein